MLSLLRSGRTTRQLSYTFKPPRPEPNCKASQVNNFPVFGITGLGGLALDSLSKRFQPYHLGHQVCATVNFPTDANAVRQASTSARGRTHALSFSWSGRVSEPRRSGAEYSENIGTQTQEACRRKAESCTSRWLLSAGASCPNVR